MSKMDCNYYHRFGWGKKQTKLIYHMPWFINYHESLFIGPIKIDRKN